MGGGLARPQLLCLGMLGIIVFIYLQYIFAANDDQGFIDVHTQNLVHGHQLAPADAAGLPIFRRVVGYTPCSKLFGFAGDRDTDLAGSVRNEFCGQGIRTAKKMLIVGALIAIYVLYVTVIFFKNAFSKNFKDKNYSRTVSSYWGLCGIFGFLGFSGFWTYFEYGKIYPFVFFIFFGFFGFFFEGKLSHTLEDELFLENKRKAEINAYKVGFKLLFIVIWLMAIGMFSRNVEWCAIFMLISVSLIYALVIFLSNYLLYRYEKGE